MLAAKTTATKLVSITGRRGLATALDSIKVAAVDNGQATTSVTLVVKAGSRYEHIPGVAHVLKNFAFKGTGSRSALKTVRESELYGGVLSATLGREHLALTADFLRGDEEHFVDVLSGVLTSTNFATHELHETVAPQVEAEALAASSDPTAIALDTAHSLAFRNGLGNPIFASHPVPLDAVKDFASKAFTKDNIVVIGSGISDEKLAELVGKKLKTLPSGGAKTTELSKTTKYFGGESRLSVHGSSSTLFIGFGSDKPDAAALSVLAAHLDPTPSIKWTEGSSPLSKLGPGVQVNIVNESYSDGALFGVLLHGEDVDKVKEAGKTAVKALKEAVDGTGLKDDAFKRAVAKAKYTAASALESGREVSSAVLAYKLFSGNVDSTSALKVFDGVKAADVSKAAKTLTASKPTYVAVGNVGILPYADELGL